MEQKHRILILTAGFGDGHNSAARNLAEALKEKAFVRVADPCDLGNPRINEFLKTSYRFIITHLPRLWGWLYKRTDRTDFSKPVPFLRSTENALGELLERNKPHLIICTYPLYPYLLKRLFLDHKSVPIITAVTDSMEINSAWTRSPSDFFLVTDHGTREALMADGIPEEKIHVTGFPVSVRFPLLPHLYSTASVEPFKVVFFATRRLPHVRRIMKAILAIPNTQVTLVLGRSVRQLYRRAKQIEKAYPGRVTLKGWTKKVPHLLCSHHLVIGKAGGATVHEALAARCPMLIHHLVPGQEEGNIQLLERFGVGRYTPTAAEIGKAVRELLADDARLWREQKDRLLERSRPCGALEAADFILNHLDPPQARTWGFPTTTRHSSR